MVRVVRDVDDDDDDDNDEYSFTRQRARAQSRERSSATAATTLTLMHTRHCDLWSLVSSGCAPVPLPLRLTDHAAATPKHANPASTLAEMTAARAAADQHNQPPSPALSEHCCVAEGAADCRSARMNATATPALQPNPVCGTYSPPPPDAPLTAAEYFSNNVPLAFQLCCAAVKYVRSTWPASSVADASASDRSAAEVKN